MDHPDTPLHLGLGRESLPPLAHGFEKTVRRCKCDWPWGTSFRYEFNRCQCTYQ